MKNNNAKLPKLTVDIFNKGLRRFYRWAAIDADGIVLLYPEKPTIIGRTWSGKDEGACFNLHFDTSDWQNSLIENPAFKEKETGGDKNMKTLPKLTTDVFNRPDCPEWAKWAAVDKSGECYVYSGMPIRRDNAWRFLFGECCYVGRRDASDWQNSLIERPAADLPEHDDVKAPSYYVNTPFGMELKKITCHYDFNCGSALKYIIRHGKKVYGGMTAKESAIKDLGKAIESLHNEIEYIKANWEE